MENANEYPLSYNTPHDPRPTLAQVLAAYDAAVSYWHADDIEEKQAA